MWVPLSLSLWGVGDKSPRGRGRDGGPALIWRGGVGVTKGGDPDVRTVAKMVLNDWLRGKLPFHTMPPTTTTAEAAAAEATPLPPSEGAGSTAEAAGNDAGDDIDNDNDEGEEEDDDEEDQDVDEDVDEDEEDSAASDDA
jgi:nuclear GTP-binding protein